jgi:phosphoribosylformimino-5-aminoimidazole carboxamide ribotide isomerase
VVAVAPVVDLLPAIDIRSGRVVRLSQGEATRQTVYGDDPAQVAEQFVRQGAKWIHVVDLDRAFGTGENSAAVAQIAARVGTRVRLQLAGGYRALDLVRSALAVGAARVVIGTAAAFDPTFVTMAVQSVGPKYLAVGIDVRDNRVAVRGWTETSSLTADEVARRVVNEGIETLIYTDISRDGMLAGPDFTGAAALRRCGAGVILSGGVTTAADVHAARKAGLSGVIIGRALYEGRLSLGDALDASGASEG